MGFVNDVGMVFVARSVKVPEILRPLQIHLSILAVATDGYDQIKVGIGTALHKGVSGNDIVADFIVIA